MQITSYKNKEYKHVNFTLTLYVIFLAQSRNASCWIFMLAFGLADDSQNNSIALEVTSRIKASL